MDDRDMTEAYRYIQRAAICSASFFLDYLTNDEQGRLEWWGGLKCPLFTLKVRLDPFLRQCLYVIIKSR